MPTTVTAQEGDCLCRIAMMNGFNNCLPLRVVAVNRTRGYCTRALRPGDQVVVPDPQEDDEAGEATEQTHQHQAVNTPPPAIRFVHGTPDRACRSDPTLVHLNISNYKSDKAGTNGTSSFPTGFGYGRDGHADPDMFKVEVVDPGAATGTLNATIRALKPRYDADGNIALDSDDNPIYEEFPSGVDRAALREITVACNSVSRRSQVRFRSRYLRLVTDEHDFAAISGNPKRSDGTAQGLLVSDLADGAHGANDFVEILDQHVQAVYELRNCPAPAAEHTCRVACELEVGPRRRSIPISITILKTAVGAAAVGALTEAMVRKRTYKWFRRFYAQAELAPTIVDDGVQIVDPPPPDMIVLGQGDNGTGAGAGTAATAINAVGTASKIVFRLGRPPGTGATTGRTAAARAAAATAALAAAPRVEVALTAGMTPEQAGAAISAALPSGYSAAVGTNALARNGAVNRSCDVLISHTDGHRVMVRSAVCDDTGLTLRVATVDPASLDRNCHRNELLAGSPAMRSVARHFPGEELQLDFYIVAALDAPARGRACPPAIDWGNTSARHPLNNVAFLMSTTMNQSDRNPFSFPHEAGHVLMDGFHADNSTTNGRYELMAGGGTSRVDALDATKRICDDPIRVRYAHWTSASPPPAVSAVQRIRDRNRTLLEDW